MQALKRKVYPLEENDSATSGSKFLHFLHSICFIVVNEKDGKLKFKLFSCKTLFHIFLVIGILCGFPIICIFAFEYDSTISYNSSETIVEMISFGLITTATLIPVLQPLILRYPKKTIRNTKKNYFQCILAVVLMI